ncbi:hypothetical protein ACFE04_021551 [Oxalis oulophora]
MASASDEEWYNFLDRYIPFEVNSRRPKSLEKELRKVIPIIPSTSRTGPRDMESFKLYLREVIFNYGILYEETLNLSESEYNPSLISVMLRIIDYLSLPCHIDEDFYAEFMKHKREITQLQEEIKELRLQNSKLMKHLTKESLFKSSYMKVMNVLHLSQERNQGMVKVKINYGKYCNSPRFRSELFKIEAKFKLDKSSLKTEEKESRTSEPLLCDIRRLSIQEVNPNLEDRVVRKEHICQTETVVKKLSGIVKSELMCVICRDVISKPMLLQCGHMFCETCLHFWSKVNSACPYCRSQIQGKVKVPIDSFMVEMCKLILSNCNMKRSKLKPSESKTSRSSIFKTSDTRTIRRSFNRRSARAEVPSLAENQRN